VARLATLSYLTADPEQRAAAYGLALPPPMAPERIALTYALARLLVALHDAAPPAGHGDLSARNVLWSLQDAPRVYLIDCDNSEVGAATLPGGEPGEPRRRAMTPNWDDPTIPPGANPDLFSDRYSLALIFLRVAGAAHYPVQRRQRRREMVAIDFDVPEVARHLPSLRRGAPIWGLCAAGLSMKRSGRPAAATWAAALEVVLDDLARELGTDLGQRVRSAQDGCAAEATADSRDSWDRREGWDRGAPPAPPAPAVLHSVSDVIVRPVAQSARTQAWRVASTKPAEGEEETELLTTNAQIRRQLRYSAVWWWIAHRRMFRLLVGRGTHLKGARRLVFLFLVDFALACAALFVLAMIVSPFLGI
jgi:hypothetical protein